MQFPPFKGPQLKGILPAEAIKQLSQWVNQPALTNAIKEAAQKIGIQDTSPLTNVQDMLRSAGRWVESMIEPWVTGDSPQLKPGINATGEWFHARNTAPRMSHHGAALAAMLQSNFTDGFAVEASLQRALLASTGAPDGLVVPNLSIALWLVSHTLREAGMVEEVVLPRVACVRLPSSSSAGSVQLRSVLDSTLVEVCEIGSSADCEREDYRKALTHAKQLLLVASPSRPEDHYEAGIAIARESSAIVCELAIDACQHDLPAIGGGVRALSRRWDRGPDLIVAPGQFLLGGPECGIVLGKRELVTAIRQVAESLGMLCDRLTAALLCQTLLEGENEAAWLATPTPAALTTSIENLEHRARRIAAQSDISESIEKIEVQRMPLRLGAGGWQNVRLESAVLRVYPRGMRPSSLADALSNRRIPIWCNVGSESIDLAMRTIDPAEDTLVVDALLQPHQSPEFRSAESRPAESRSTEVVVDSTKVVGKDEPS